MLIDFRDEQHLRRHELLQQTINELTAGVIGVSHFTNWYYFIGADFYNFYQGRHGAATSHADRLDCYAQFRTALSLDHQLDGDLRQEMQRRVEGAFDQSTGSLRKQRDESRTESLEATRCAGAGR